MRLLLDRAWVGGEVRERVAVEVSAGRFTRVEPEVEPDIEQAAGEFLPGLTLPGFANTHSHAFHRALRGRTQRDRGTFWTWREQMYAAAGRLDPDSYFALARATFAEMASAGFTSVGEFHYVHHRPGGAPYDDPNAMGAAVGAAAREVGLRMTLLDTCYLAGGFGLPLSAEQARFGDGDVRAWAARISRHDPGDAAVIGAAIHSVRAVPREALSSVAAWARDRDAPLHVHLSEQVAENEACLAAHGLTPAELLAAEGVLGPRTTVVHATHLTDRDIALLGDSGTTVSFCPTTERDLGDGIGPARLLLDAGARLAVGSDSHAVVDPFEETRAIEVDERLATGRRGHFSAAELMTAGTAHAALGVEDAGAIEVGRRADLVTLDTRSPRSAGTGADLNTAIYAAGAADVRRVMIDGTVVFDGDHAAVGADLARAIERIHP